MERSLQWALAAVVASSVVECARVSANTNGEPRVAAALLDRFETVFYARSKLVTGSGDVGGLSGADGSALRVPFADLMYGLESLRQGAFVDVVAASEAVFVGARNFAPPRGPPPHLGGVRSRFCYVVVLGTRGGSDLRRYASGPPAGHLAGEEIWRWAGTSQEGDERPTVFVAVRVGRAYLLVSNDLDDLRAVGSALSSDRAVQGGIPVPNAVLQQSMWGYRREPRPGDVPTHDEAAAMAAGVRSLLFFVDVNEKKAVVRAESAKDDAPPGLGEHLPPPRRTASGKWETVLPLAGDERSVERMLAALGLFGFGIYL